MKCILKLILFAYLFAIFAVESEAQDSAFTFSLGGIRLFDVPLFAPPNVINAETERNANRYRYESNIDPDILEDSKLKTPDLLLKYGYPSEIHHTTTEDGYILELHRIPKPGAMPVLLTHGLLDSSATWIMMGPNKGLGYLLADKGYDVWMTNVRGNTYSRNHTKYTPRQAEFWDYTFHEMGKYDIPASIKYVLRKTSQPKLHYIGHSQGTMTYFIMCSERPEMCDKVVLMQALAPVSYIKNTRSPMVQVMALFQDPLSFFLRIIGANEFLPTSDFIKLFCDEDALTDVICSNIVSMISGYDRAQMNDTMLPVILGHMPAGASTKQMHHYAQMKRSGHFRPFDYGWIQNQQHYGSNEPPEYNLKNVGSKVALHYSQNDWLAVPEDVQKLRQLLPNVVGKFMVKDPKFNHFDFVWGINAKKMLYNKVMKLMKMADRGDLDKA